MTRQKTKDIMVQDDKQPKFWRGHIQGWGRVDEEKPFRELPDGVRQREALSKITPEKQV